MARHARNKSSSGIYHVILRGINRQILFEDDSDYQKFKYILSDQLEKTPFKLYAYCLMSNHIHLLIKELDTPISMLMKSIEVRFVMWYNNTHERVGYLFSNRFKSECVESEDYFLTAIRYIHNNPVKAGLVSHPADYIWSSAIAYWGAKDELVDTSFAQNCHPLLLDFLLQENDDSCIDVDDDIHKITDNDALSLLMMHTTCSGPSDFQRLPRHKRNIYLYELHAIGLSISQISRVCGVPISTIKYHIRKKKMLLS